jgi:hypothetical protein
MALSPTASRAGVFLTATKTMTSAQIKALNTTAIQLLPAVAGALVLPVSVTWLFSPIGTTAYTVPGQLYVDPCGIFTSTGGTGLVPTGLSSLLQTSPTVEQVTVDDFLAGLTSLFNGLTGVLLASMVNQPVMLRTDTGNPTLGDSGLKAVLVYQVVTP